MSISHCNKEQPENPNPAKKTKLLLLSLSFARCSGLGLSREIHCNPSIITPAYRAGTVRHTKVPTLALHERVGLEGMVRATLTRLRSVMSHPDYHGPTIPPFHILRHPKVTMLQKRNPAIKTGLHALSERDYLN